MLTNALNISSIASEILSPKIVSITKVLNESGASNNVDLFMDSVKGLGHRIKHGHDLSNLLEVYENYGFDGVIKFFKHLFGEDLMSPHGIPLLPYTKEIGEALGLSTKDMINWMCVNIGDLISGGFAITNSYVNYKLITKGDFDERKLLFLLLSSGIKLTTSTINPNPITFATSLFDLGLATYAGVPMIWDYFNPKYSFKLALYNSAKLGGQSLITEVAFLSAIELKNKKNLKDLDYKRIAKEASISGICTSVSKMIYDTTKYYVSKNEVLLSIVSTTTCFSSKQLINKVIKSVESFSQRRIANSQNIIDVNIIPVY